MELRQALADVAEIREHLARTEQFRGYRSLTVAFTGLVGISAAIIQANCLLQPTDHLAAYLAVWIGASAINLAVVSVEIGFRIRRAETALARRTTILAVEQFLPPLMVGGLLTVIILQRASESAWMLPGLWSLLFSLAIFASCRALPRTVNFAGAWYLSGGVLALMWGQGASALSPWCMGVLFGGGQLLTAVIFYLTLERGAASRD